MLFRILFIFDALVALTVLAFLAWGLSDGSVSADNAGLWLAIVLALAGILGGGYLLRANGQPRAAKALLLALAVPGALYLLFILMVLVLQPRWN